MLQPPPGYTIRPPTRADAPALAALIASCQRAEGDAAETSAADVLNGWNELDLTEDAVLVVAEDGRLAGCAEIPNRRFVNVSVYGFVEPEQVGRRVGGWLVRWGEGWARARMERSTAGARVVAQHYLPAANVAAQALLTTHGYASARTYYRIGITLTQPPAPSAWPAGSARVRAARAMTSAPRSNWSKTPSAMSGIVRRARLSASGN